MGAIGDLVLKLAADSIRFTEAMERAEHEAERAARTVVLRSRNPPWPSLVLVIKPLAAALARVRLVTL